MKLDNLSKHGILTASLIVIFLTIMTILAANKIHEINYLTEMFRDFNEFEQNPPPSLDVPIAVIVISLVMLIITGLMIFGIIKERLLFIAPWLILFSFGVIGEIIFFVHQLIRYFSLELLLYILCILGIQLLILSPIALIFHGIRCKNRVKHFLESNLQHEVRTNPDPAAAKHSI